MPYRAAQAFGGARRTIVGDRPRQPALDRRRQHLRLHLFEPGVRGIDDDQRPAGRADRQAILDRGHRDRRRIEAGILGRGHEPAVDQPAPLGRRQRRDAADLEERLAVEDHHRAVGGPSVSCACACAIPARGSAASSRTSRTSTLKPTTLPGTLWPPVPSPAPVVPTAQSVCQAPLLPDAMIASQTCVVSSASRNVGAAGLPVVSPRGNRRSVARRMLVADDEAGHPPFAEIGVLAVGDEDRGPAAQRALDASGRTMRGGSGRAGPRRTSRARR